MNQFIEHLEEKIKLENHRIIRSISDAILDHLQKIHSCQSFIEAGIRNSGNKLESVKFVKTVTGLGLKESHDIVTAVLEGESYFSAYERISVQS